MTAGMGRRKRTPVTSRDYRAVQVFLWCLLAAGPALIYYGVHANQRDRPSLQWPSVPGTIVQSQRVYFPTAKHSRYIANVAYIYHVDGRVYATDRIQLWNPDLRGENVLIDTFVAAHPVGSTVNVYYDPKQPGMAALITGADETGNRFYIWCGALLSIFTSMAVYQSRNFFPKATARAKAAEATRAAHPPGKSLGPDRT